MGGEEPRGMETEDCLLGKVKAVMNDGGGPRRHPRGTVSCGPQLMDTRWIGRQDGIVSMNELN